MQNRTFVLDRLSSSLVRLMQPLLDRRDFAEALDCYTQFIAGGEAIDGSMAVPHHLAAKAHLALQNPAGALKCARLAQAAASKDGDSTVLAEIFLTLGSVLRDLGQVRESLRAYSDAESIFRRNDHTEGRCRALNLLAGVYFKQTDYRHALSTLLEALEMARAIGDNAKIAYMMGNIGRIQTFLGDLSDAERHLKTNLELSEDLGDQLEVARAHLSLGYVQMQRGNYDEADQSFMAAQSLLVVSGSRRDEAICLSYQGELARRRGDLADSQILLDKALHLAEKVAPETTLVGRILRQQAETMIAVGNFRIAQKMVARALPIMGGNGDQVTCGALWKLQAVLGEIQKPTDSSAAIHKALDLLTEAGVRFELAEALQTAGSLKIFSVRQRMTYLFRAEEIFAHTGLLARSNEVQIAIDLLDRGNREPGDIATANAVDFESDYISCSPEVQRIKEEMLTCGSRSDMPILLTGPTGVGKTALATYFHHRVFPRRPFIVVNCAAIPDTLLESELFGYVAGAFTGADRRTIGKFEAANHGVILLDEIGDMPLALQAKLLGVIERRKVTPLGSVEEIDLDVRLIAATNQSLPELVAQNRFRSDLYYRLSGLSFDIPALADRPEDIPLLADYYLRQYQLLAEGQSAPPELLRYLMAQEWPGNIRELDFAIRKIRSMGKSIEHGDLLTMYPAIVANRPAPAVGNLFEQVEEFERNLLVQTLRAVGGNKCQAARILGIHEATVRTKIKRYGLDQNLDAPAAGSC